MRGTVRIVVAVLIAGLGIVLPGIGNRTLVAAPAGVRLVTGNIEQPTVLAIDPHGNVYAAVFGVCGLYDSIIKLAPNGTIERRFEFTYGTAPGQFKAITGLAVDAAGNMYIADFLNSRIQKLSPGGAPLAVWRGNQGAGPGLRYPQAITLDAQGNLYVLDSGASRVVKLSSSGTVLAALSTGYNSDLPDIAPFVEFGLPNELGLDAASALAGLAVDATGNIFVATGHDLRKLSPTGAPLAVWRPPWGKGYRQAPSQVTVDPAGNIITSGSPEPIHQSSNGNIVTVGVDEIGGGNIIDELSPSGKLVRQLGQPGIGSAQFVNPVGLATDAASNLYVADMAGNRIQKLARSGALRAVWGNTGSLSPPRGRFGPFLGGLAVGAKGRLVVASGLRAQLIQLSPAGRIVSRWNPSVRGFANGAQGLTTDRRGNLYIGDRTDTGVVELSPRGKRLHHWVMPPYHDQFPGVPPSSLPKGLPKAPQVNGIAVAPWGRIYATADDSLWVVARSKRKFKKLVRGSNTISYRGSHVVRPKHALQVVADGPRGNKLYSIDSESRVDVFSPGGKQLGRRQPGEVCAGLIFNPVAIAVGPRGTLYAADGDPIDQILKFSPTGRLLARWGSRGTGTDQFRFLFSAGLAVGRRGNVFVTDFSGRLRKFSPAGKLLASWR